jgi:hypothetical protein
VLDFDAHITTMRLPRWRVARIGKRSSQLFAAQATLGVTTFREIRKATFRMRRKWAAVLRDIAGRRLWYFYPNEPEAVDQSFFDVVRFGLTFRRALCCRPSFLFYYPAKRRRADKRINYQIRPCLRPMCPFCFARQSQWQFLYVKKKLNTWLAENVQPLSLVYRSRREFVPAAGFDPQAGCGLQDVLKLARQLRAVVQAHRTAYKKLERTRHLQLKTLGALWRVVVIPTENGWFVETRQFIVAPRSMKKLPFVELPKNCTGTYMRLTATRNPADYHELNDKFYTLFMEFCRYPQDFLTVSGELAAATLWAVDGLRRISAVGGLRGAVSRTAGLKRLTQNCFAVKNAEKEKNR